MSKNKIIEKFRKYHFEFKHLTIIFIVLLSFQVIVSFINKTSIRNLLGNTQEWYQKDSAEKLANLTTTSLELILEPLNRKEKLSEDEERRIIESFNIIFSQQILQHNIDDICILVERNKKTYAIDEGKQLYNFLFKPDLMPDNSENKHKNAVKLYNQYKTELIAKEQIKSVTTQEKTFNTFVPFVLRGEYKGAVYIKNTPDFSFITGQIISNYDETSLIYLSLISLGLLSMYFVSSYTVRERDEAQKQLFLEHELSLKKQITYEKELVFTKRIYHTHHKAEKVMGFIKGDLALLSPENINEVKYRVNKYANFISRIIYDMKWYEPPVQTIRNPIFNTDVNDVIQFMVNHIFLRSHKKSSTFEVELNLAESLPRLCVNEFVVWEILEPIIQNSIDHSEKQNILIKICTEYHEEKNHTHIKIRDNGRGISPELLQTNGYGIKKIFEENVTTKQTTIRNTGYGCYIAYEISKRCGWKLDVNNLTEGGCEFFIAISN